LDDYFINQPYRKRTPNFGGPNDDGLTRKCSLNKPHFTLDPGDPSAIMA